MSKYDLYKPHKKPLKPALLLFIGTAAVVLLLYSNSRTQQSMAPFLAITIPSVHRHGNVTYLSDTVKSLYCALGANTASWPPVVVVNAEYPASKHTDFASLQQDTRFQDARQHGLHLITMAEMHGELHAPSFVAMLAGRAVTDMQPRVSPRPEVPEADEAGRLWWRSKECLDAACALKAVQHVAPRARYYLFVQDDVQFAAGFDESLQRFCKDNPNADVVSLFVGGGAGTHPVPLKPGQGHVGLVALLFRSAVVNEFIHFVKPRFADKPVDWLLEQLVNERNLTTWAYYPNLVQHVGKSSSLQGKVQNIVSGTFAGKGC